MARALADPRPGVLSQVTTEDASSCREPPVADPGKPLSAETTRRRATLSAGAMCGRFSMALANADAVTDALRVVGARWADPADAAAFAPRAEVRPTTRVPVAIASASAPLALAARSAAVPPPPVAVHYMRWGLIPSFAPRDASATVGPPLINARSETVLEKPSFRAIAAVGGSRRCVVVAHGYYEWYTYPEQLAPGKTRPPPKKLPYLVHWAPASEIVPGPAEESPSPSPQPLLMAGVYDVWGGDGRAEVAGDIDNAAGSPTAPTASFALITMAAGETLSWLHHRQPVLLPSEDAARAWLDTELAPEEACARALDASRAATAPTAATTSTGCSATPSPALAWTRMVTDLSAPVPAARQGKPPPPPRIASISTFFAAKSVTTPEKQPGKRPRSISSQSPLLPHASKLSPGKRPRPALSPSRGFVKPTPSPSRGFVKPTPSLSRGVAKGSIDKRGRPGSSSAHTAAADRGSIASFFTPKSPSTSKETKKDGIS